MVEPIGRGNNNKSESKVVPVGKLRGDHIVTQEKEASSAKIAGQKLYDPDSSLEAKVSPDFKNKTTAKIQNLIQKKV